MSWIMSNPGTIGAVIVVVPFSPVGLGWENPGAGGGGGEPYLFLS